MQRLVHRTDRPQTIIKIQRTHPVHYIKQPTTGIRPLYSTQRKRIWTYGNFYDLATFRTKKNKPKNAMENYYIHYFHKHNMTIREQNQEEKKSIIRNNPQCAIPTLRRISPLHQPRPQPSYSPPHTSVPTSVLHHLHITYNLVRTSSTTVSPFTTFYYSIMY